MDDTKAAELFGEWAAKEGLLGRITEDQCADLARAFIAGWFYGQNPILRESLRTGPPRSGGEEERDADRSG